VRLNRFGRELRRFDFIPFFVRGGALHFLPRDGQLRRPGIELRIRYTTVDIFRRNRSQLGTVGRDQRHVHICYRNRLVAVIGHDEKYGQEAVLVEVDGKQFRFVA